MLNAAEWAVIGFLALLFVGWVALRTFRVMCRTVHDEGLKAKPERPAAAGSSAGRS